MYEWLPLTLQNRSCNHRDDLLLFDPLENYIFLHNLQMKTFITWLDKDKREREKFHCIALASFIVWLEMHILSFFCWCSMWEEKEDWSLRHNLGWVDSLELISLRSTIACAQWIIFILFLSELNLSSHSHLP